MGQDHSRKGAVVTQKRAAKQKAQELLMHGIGNVLGYWSEDDNNQRDIKALGLSEEEFGDLLVAQADRVAHMFGYENAWSN